MFVKHNFSCSENKFLIILLFDNQIKFNYIGKSNRDPEFVLEEKMLKIGCSEQVLEVPLFMELYGYGMFQGRRNQGTHDYLYCRAYCFNDGEHQAVIIYTDTCITDDLYAREMRAQLASRYQLEPDYIAFVATHTHSAPPLGVHCGTGFGEPDPAFQLIWKDAVIKVAGEALKNEEEIASAEAGRASLARKLGKNRIDPQANVTDETIRWVKFQRADGSCKLLLHNHGIHGVSMNIPFNKIVSADWMGAANRLIKEQKLADMPLFMLGPCGDVNTYTSCRDIKNDTAADLIGSQYVADLERSMSADGEKLTDFKVRAALKSMKFPVVKQTEAELRQDADSFRSLGDVWGANLIEEMILLLKRGENMVPVHDLQVIRIGELSLFFIPGEYFVEDGASLMARAAGRYSFAVTVANGNGSYFPSEADMKLFPAVKSREEHKNNCSYGFYEIYGYPCRHNFKYQDNIAEFVADQLINMEKSL